jgi:hypothetical protein
MYGNTKTRFGKYCPVHMYLGKSLLAPPYYNLFNYTLSLSLDVWQYQDKIWRTLSCSHVYGEEVPTPRSNHTAAIWGDVLLVLGTTSFH